MLSKRFCCSFVLSLIVTSSTAAGQAGPSSSAMSSLEVSPATTIDSSALSVIANHLNAVHSGQWAALTAAGSITLPGLASASADLTMSGSSQCILKLGSSAPIRSILSDGKTLRTVHADGSTTTMVEEAGLSGLLQFQLLRAADFSRRLLSLKDEGPVKVDGRAYLELSAVFLEPNPPSTISGSKPNTIKILFDFDPGTMFLARSVTKVKIPGSPNNLASLATTYSDYRASGTVLIPHAIAQTLDGQPQWTLNLTDVSLTAPVDLSLFSF